MTDPTLKIANQVKSTHPSINGRRITTISFNGRTIKFNPPGSLPQIDLWPQINTTSSVEKKASATGADDFPEPVSINKAWNVFGADTWTEFYTLYPTGNIYINEWAGARGANTETKPDNTKFKTVNIWEAPDPVPAKHDDLNEESNRYDPSEGEIVSELSPLAWASSGHGGWSKSMASIMVYRRGTNIVCWCQSASRVWHNWSSNYPQADSQAWLRNLTFYRTTNATVLKYFKDKGIEVPETITIPVDLKAGGENDEGRKEGTQKN